jgi:hypothetical protein
VLRSAILQLVRSGTLTRKFTSDEAFYLYIELLLRLDPDERQECAYFPERRHEIYLLKTFKLQREIIGSRGNFLFSQEENNAKNQHKKTKNSLKKLKEQKVKLKRQNSIGKKEKQIKETEELERQHLSKAALTAELPYDSDFEEAEDEFDEYEDMDYVRHRSLRRSVEKKENVKTTSTENLTDTFGAISFSPISKFPALDSRSPTTDDINNLDFSFLSTMEYELTLTTGTQENTNPFFSRIFFSSVQETSELTTVSSSPIFSNPQVSNFPWAGLTPQSDNKQSSTTYSVVTTTSTSINSTENLSSVRSTTSQTNFYSQALSNFGTFSSPSSDSSTNLSTRESEKNDKTTEHDGP